MSRIIVPDALRFVAIPSFCLNVVPQFYGPLGGFVHQQRSQYKLLKKGRKSTMTPERLMKLTDIGFVFEVKPRKKGVSNDEEPSLRHAAARAVAWQRRMEAQNQEESDKEDPEQDDKRPMAVIELPQFQVQQFALEGRRQDQLY